MFGEEFISSSRMWFAQNIKRFKGVDNTAGSDI